MACDTISTRRRRGKDMGLTLSAMVEDYVYVSLDDENGLKCKILVIRSRLSDVFDLISRVVQDTNITQPHLNIYTSVGRQIETILNLPFPSPPSCSTTDLHRALSYSTSRSWNTNNSSSVPDGLRFFLDEVLCHWRTS